MRRARLEGRHIGRRPLELARPGIERDRASGMIGPTLACLLWGFILILIGWTMDQSPPTTNSSGTLAAVTWGCYPAGS